MTNRQKKILQLIIKNYINTADPVGSKHLKNKCKLDISSATIRNEMSDLADLGFLSKPHVSAGRVPTLKAFNYYIDNLLNLKDLSQKEKKNFSKIIKQHTGQERLKVVLKEIVSLSEELGVLIFNKRSFYYTGFTYLFKQPEFENHSSVETISQVVDSLDNVMAEVSDQIGKETRIMIGENNPLSEFCGAIFCSFKTKNDNNRKIMGIIGPTRMDYAKNLALLNYSKEILKN